MALEHCIFAQALRLNDGTYRAWAYDSGRVKRHPHDAQFMRPLPDGYLKGNKHKTLDGAIADAKRFRNALLAASTRPMKLDDAYHTGPGWSEHYYPVDRQRPF